MKSLVFITLFLIPLTSFANASYRVATVDSGQCRSVGHPEAYVRQICDQIQLGGADQVEISGNSLRSDLVVNRGHSGNNPYYMALGIDNANYSVSGDIQVVMRQNALGRWVRHALVYRLDYETYAGESGYQIVTIRLGTGLRAAEKTCTMASFDVTGATRFANVPLAQRESAMRQQAIVQTQADDFQSASNRCMLYEEPQAREPRQAPTFEFDPNEGDSEELSHP